MFDIEYEFRQEDLIHFNEIRVKKNPELQNEFRKHRFLILGVMLFVSFFYYLYYKDIEIPAYILVLGCLWIFGFKPYEMKIDIRRQILAKYTEAEKEAMFGEYKLSIEQDHLLEKSPSGKHKMAWKDLVRIEESDKYVYIYVDLDAALVIPKETLKSGDLKQFTKQAEGMIERAS
jgi:hypothetical protein